MFHLSTQANVNFETNIVSCYYVLRRQKTNEEQDTQTNHKRKRVHTGYKRV